MPERAVFLAAFAIAILSCTASARAAAYRNWAAVVVAGDDADSEGYLTNGFDNARHDVTRDLVRLGFEPAHIAEFSLRPHAFRGEKLFRTSPSAILRHLRSLTRAAPGGCLLYFSSHGEDHGLVVGNWIMPPLALAHTVDATCGARPTVVILSACFSGVMLPALEGPNRMILTAARRDRSSFGCGQSDRYPYFDQCVLQSWNGATGFADLAARTRACVARRERAEHLKPPSEPQFWIGPLAQSSLPRWW